MIKNIKIKTHVIFGNVRFSRDVDEYYKPITEDIVKILKLDKNKISFKSSHLLENKELLELINNSSIEHLELFKSWIFNRALNALNKDIINRNYTYENVRDVILSITDDDFIEIPIHPISNNEMYTANKDKVTTSDKYREWRKLFPYELLKPFKNIDFRRPIMAIYQYDQLESYDTENFNKATSDAICSFFATNDHQIRFICSECHNIVDNRKDGKIRIFLCNIKAGL